MVMHDQTRLDIALPDPAATEALAQVFADHAAVGDSYLLSGPVGAGKSHFARAFIRHRLGRAEDIPSPTFTLVQTYEATTGDMWHADLYRLSHPDEVVELGLEDAFSTAICLIEWPDRLGSLCPANPICIDLRHSGDARQARISFAQRPALAVALGHV